MCDESLDALKARIEAQNFLICELFRQNREMKSLVKFVERENARIRTRNAILCREKIMLKKELNAFADQISDLKKFAGETGKINLSDNARED